jgi:carbonic anhydrase
VLSRLLQNNRAWAEERKRRDPEFFERLCAIQKPEYLWIGCADSRVPANEIVGLDPGELFVQRNVANVVSADDVNCMAVVQYAIEVLGVKQVIVCGHYGCGGVEAALNSNPLNGPIDRWVQHVRHVRSAHAMELERLLDHEARWRRLCELNVMEQVQAAARTSVVQEAWKRGTGVAIHGWIYDLHDGLLRDLHVTATA